MVANRLAGPGAGSEKYDLLTAMAVAGLSGTPQQQSTMMRLIALVTARYNWTADELTVGQREMAAMWSVDERTVKREIKRMTQSELLVQKRAGVRGSVAAYRLNLAVVYKLSEPLWRKVGPDFAERMDLRVPRAEDTIVRVDFQSRTTQQQDDPADPWTRVLKRLEVDHPTSFAAWFSKLKLAKLTDSSLCLQAPSRFLALYIQTHLLATLAVAVKSELGSRIQVKILLPS